MKTNNQDDILKWFAVLVFQNFIEKPQKNQPKWKHPTYLGFTILSITLLLAPVSFNPLSNPFVNPFTDFADYPEPLRQFYSERLFAQWNYMQPAYAEIISTTKRIASPTNPNISDREIINYGNGTFKQRIGIPMYVLDTDDTFKDSFMESNSTHIKLVNAENPIIFQKSDCTFVKYTDVGFNTKFADYYTTMAYKPQDKAWIVYDALQLPCTYNTFTNSTGQYLTVQRVHQKGTFDVIYTKLIDGAFKSYMQFTNAGSPNGFTDTRVSFVEVIGNITTTSFNINGTNRWDSLDIGTQKIFTQKDLTSKNKQAFHIAKGSLLFNIDLGSDFADLLAIRATKTSTTTFDLEIGFGATTSNLVYNQIVRNDPTFTSSNPTVDGETRDTNDDDVCSIASEGTTTSTTMSVYYRSAGSLQDCVVSYVEWDTSSIPDTATISDTIFKFDVSDASAARNCDYNSMLAGQPSTRTNQQIMDDILDTGTYVDADVTCTTTGDNKSVDLGSSADSDLETLLTSDYFAVGIMPDGTITPGQGAESMTFATEEDATATPSSTLEVTYVTTIDFQVDVNEADETTAVTDGDVIVINSTGTFTFALNSTGIARILQVSQPANQNLTVKDGNNYITNKTLNVAPSTDEEVITIDSLVHDVSGCDATILNLKQNDTDGHYIASVPISPSCLNDVLTFDYFYKTTGSGSAGSNYTTTLRFEVGTSSVYARCHQILVNGSDVGCTYSNGVVTSGTIQVDDGASNVILKVTINLRGDHYVQAFENDGTTTITVADILNTNSSTTGTNSVNSTGWAFITGITGSQNMTLKETTDNIVTNKTYNTQLTGNTYLNGLIFNESCPQNGSGDDFKFKANHTNYHRISTHTTPTCATTGSNFNVTASITFTADGNAPSHDNQTSSLILTIPNATAFGKDARVLRINGTVVDTSFADNKITSSSFDVASGYNTVLLNVDISLDPRPEQVTGLSADCSANTACTISWTAPDAGVAGISGYFIERSVDSGSTWSTLVEDTGSTSVSYEDTGLDTGTRYDYRVSAINQYGTGQVSNSANGTTGTSSPTGGGGGGGGGETGGVPLQPLDTSKTSELKITLHPTTVKVLFAQTSYKGTIKIDWNSAEPLIVTGLNAGTFNDWFVFRQQPFPLEGGNGISTGDVEFTVRLPHPFCEDLNNVNINPCINKGIHNVPITISVDVDGQPSTQSTSVTIDTRTDVEIATYVVFLAFTGGIGVIAVNIVRKKRHGSFLKALDRLR